VALDKESMEKPVKLEELEALSGRYIGFVLLNGEDRREVTVSRGNIKTADWRKLILRLKAAGFDHNPGQCEWFGYLIREKKSWVTRDGLVPA
jgi:hypothetical protein